MNVGCLESKVWDQGEYTIAVECTRGWLTSACPLRQNGKFNRHYGFEQTALNRILMEADEEKRLDVA